MATTKDIIEALQKADPTGEMEILVQHEDYAYSITNSVKKSRVKDGVQVERKPGRYFEQADCVIIQTLF